MPAGLVPLQPVPAQQEQVPQLQGLVVQVQLVRQVQQQACPAAGHGGRLKKN
jgi:hypothetical protein